MISKVQDLSDSVFFILLFFIGFSRYLVNPSLFYPEIIQNLFFSQVSVLGFSSTPRLFWMLIFFLTLSLSLRALIHFSDGDLVSLGFLFDDSMVEDGEEYLEKHGIKRFD